MKIIVNGIATEYEDEGVGPVVLLLHGWKDSLHTFDPIVPTLSATGRVVRVDLPGFGESEMQKGDWTLDDYVGHIAAFVAKLRLEVSVLVGHSLGGRIAIKGVSRHTLLPKKLVLIAAAGVAKRSSTRAAALKAFAKVGKLATLPLPRRIRADLRTRLYARIKSDYASAGEMQGTFRKIVGEDLSPAAAAIDVPTLLIWGSSDSETPLSEGVRLSELIKGARLELFQAAGHFVHREHPAQVAELILHFI